MLTKLQQTKKDALESIYKNNELQTENFLNQNFYNLLFELHAKCKITKKQYYELKQIINLYRSFVFSSLATYKYLFINFKKIELEQIEKDFDSLGEFVCELQHKKDA